jgi:hypothetical protein
MTDRRQIVHTLALTVIVIVCAFQFGGSAGASSADEANELRGDLLVLRNAWYDAGGRDGYPFWDISYRGYLAGTVPASGLRDDSVSYRQLLKQGRSVLSSADIGTDEVSDIRETLDDSLEARIDALEALDRWLLDEFDPAGGIDPEDHAEDKATFDRRLQRSYSLARQATGDSQAAYAANGDGFLEEPLYP